MTLVIAGFKFDDPLAGYAWPGSKSQPTTTAGSSLPEPTGIFMVADSTISTGGYPNKTVLSGFQKIYEVRAALWKPYFVDVEFRGYRSEHSSCKVLVAFAGSTLTAQHYLNAISEHLQNLRLTHRRRRLGVLEDIAYVVTVPCDQSNPLLGRGVFDDTTYTQRDMDEFRLTADSVASALQHSLQHAMSSAKKYKLDEKDFETLNTPFVAGMRCPASKRYRLFKFELLKKCVPGEPMELSIEMTEVLPEQVAVLGMGGHFDSMRPPNTP